MYLHIRYLIIAYISRQGNCVCNKPRIEHKEISNSIEQWSYDNNTSLSPCNIFGSIKFIEYDYVPREHHPKVKLFY